MGEHGGRLVDQRGRGGGAAPAARDRQGGARRNDAEADRADAARAEAKESLTTRQSRAARSAATRACAFGMARSDAADALRGATLGGASAVAPASLERRRPPRLGRPLPSLGAARATAPSSGRRRDHSRASPRARPHPASGGAPRRA